MPPHPKHVTQQLRRQHIKRRTQRHQTPPVHHRQTITPQRLIQIMQRHHRRHRQLLNQPQNRQLLLNIQMIRRLIQQQHLRPLRQRPRNMPPLLLPARQRMPRPMRQMLHTHIRQRLRHNPVIKLTPRRQRRQPRRTAQLNRLQQTDRITGLRMLLHHRHLPRNVSPAQRRQALPTQANVALGRRLNPRQQLQQRRLPRAIGPDDPQVFPRPNRQAHPAKQWRALDRVTELEAFEHGAGYVLTGVHRGRFPRTRIIAKTGAPTSAVITPIGNT